MLFQEEWDEIDELLAVERKFDDTDRVYHTICTGGTLPAKLSNEDKTPLGRGEPQRDIPSAVSTKNTLEKLFLARKSVSEEASEGDTGQEFQSLPTYLSDHEDVDHQNIHNLKDNGNDLESIKEPEKRKAGGPRALRRRHGKKMDRSKVRRKSSINGHW